MKQWVVQSANLVLDLVYFGSRPCSRVPLSFDLSIRDPRYVILSLYHHIKLLYFKVHWPTTKVSRRRAPKSGGSEKLLN